VKGWELVNSYKVILLLGGLLFSSVVSSAQRIVALSPHSVELLFALGAGDRIVATTAFADYPEAAKSIPQVGGYNGIQIESVLALKPDLVVAWKGGNPDGDIDQLERLGLKVYRSETKKLEDISKELMELGKLTGFEKEAERLREKFIRDWAQIKQENSTKPKVSFYYQLWSEPLRTIAAGSWINEIMTSCGGVNIFNDNSMDYPQINLEAVVKAKPQVMIFPSHHGTEDGTSKQWGPWSEIPAVKNNHLYFINGDLLHRFSLRVTEGMRKVCSAFDAVRN
jgi:vitamin B12 transport system substrate-binding protein